MMKQDTRPYADCYNVESVYYSGCDTESYPEMDIDAFLADECIDTDDDVRADLSGDEWADYILSTIA